MVSDSLLRGKMKEEREEDGQRQFVKRENERGEQRK